MPDVFRMYIVLVRTVFLASRNGILTRLLTYTGQAEKA